MSSPIASLVFRNTSRPRPKRILKGMSLREHCITEE
jgi:hypothetical protein